MATSYFNLPAMVNEGSCLTGYTLDALLNRARDDRIVLPVCSLGTPATSLASLAPLVLPPLYHEALDEDLKAVLLARIHQCFPFYHDTSRRNDTPVDFEIVELPVERKIDTPPNDPPQVLAFSVDTAVEEHGPHLPLATDTIQSYAVLERLANEFEGFVVGPPADYGHLTWGLPFGFSIDLTPPLVSRYVTGFANAVADWFSPKAMYVVDVHGSIVHRNAIQEGLRNSRVERHTFRWLHEPLVEFSGDRGDQHAGGVETALVEHINPDLVDRRWWPARVDDLAERQMSMDHAVELSSDLPRFIEQVEAQSLNGIVGDVRNYFDVEASQMMQRMMHVAREDVRALVTELIE